MGDGKYFNRDNGKYFIRIHRENEHIKLAVLFCIYDSKTDKLVAFVNGEENVKMILDAINKES